MTVNVTARRLVAVFVCLVSTILGVAVALATQAPVSAQQPQTPVFRGRLDVIRTEVAVIDNRTGEPVTGLKQSDFTVREGGTRQDIASFVALNQEGIERPVSNRRVFLLVFGAGMSLEGPVKPYDGAITFLRQQLRPTDLAAVMVWNRVTALTTDHERLVGVVDRIRKLPTDVYVAVQRDAQSLRDLSPATQAAIDAWIAPMESGDGFLRSATTILLGTNWYATHTEEGWPWNRRIAGRDLLKVYTGIEYLRNVEGQKHVILLSNNGFSSPIKQVDPAAYISDTQDDRRLAVHANDAGVALDIIHTIGTAPNVPGNLGGHFVTMASQQVAMQSGGQFTSVRTASQQLTRLDAATRSGYILGYIPSDPTMDGKYREVDVRVDRKDVTVVYRHGYTARPDPPPVDPRDLMTRIRMREAAEAMFLPDDLQVTAIATAVGAPGARQIRVEVTIDPSKLSLATAEGRWTGSLDLMILCSDAQAKIVGSLDQHMNLSMSQALYEQAKAAGIPYAANVPVSSPPRRVKVIVYNFESDRLGVANVAVK